MNSFNALGSFMYKTAYVLQKYIFPSVDASLVFYYPLDSSNGTINAGTANYASGGLPIYDASMMGFAMNTYALTNLVTGLGDLSLNNTMGSTATSYVKSDTSFNLVPSRGLSISLWVSCSGQLDICGTLISLYQNNSTFPSIELDIVGNRLFSGYYALYTIDKLSVSTRNALINPTSNPGGGTGGAFAYALKLLYSNYSGPVVQIQRSSDNAVSEIYADGNGNLRTESGTPFSTWLNSSIAYVVKLYDQTNNSKHATGQPSGNLPVISNALISTVGPKNIINTSNPLGYYIRFNGVNYLYIPNGAYPYNGSKYSTVTKTYVVDNYTTDTTTPRTRSQLNQAIFYSGITTSNNTNQILTYHNLGAGYGFVTRANDNSIKAIDVIRTADPSNYPYIYLNEPVTFTFNPSSTTKHMKIYPNGLNYADISSNINTLSTSSTGNYIGYGSINGQNNSSGCFYFFYALPIDLTDALPDKTILENTI